VVAGRDERGDGLGAAAAAFAQRAGYPLLADPLSGARRGPAAIATYDLLLRNPAFTARMRPGLVVRVGDLPTSKPLRAWLESAHDVEQGALGREAAWQDPAAVVSGVETADAAATLNAWSPPAPTDPQWLAQWRAADAAVAAAIDRELAAQELSEPGVARLLGDCLGPDATLVVASSMPIRDVEAYLGASDQLPRVLANRGANGIDGTASTAFGVAATATGPVVLLIGDVALVHDLGGLLAGRRLGLELTIVLLNNDGGGIFHFLPVSGEADAFEEHVATPHGLDFAHVAALYGFGYTRAGSGAELRAALAGDRRGTGTQMIEVRTDRAGNLALHRRVADAALAALSPPGPAASPAA
jgi:2-succinyl-5-enolpyruvyl-6-hydroxy-3-cyclohexene-1-carboxylate synthase